MRHQDIAYPLNASPAEWPPPRLASRTDLADAGGEFSLDGKDNWLPSKSSRQQAFASASRWNEHLHRYIRGIGHLFNTELQRAAQNSVAVSFEENFKLKKVETAFDFLAGEPTELVKSLMPHLESFRAEKMQIDEYPAGRTGYEGNSLSYMVQLKKNASLRIYAKTNRQIRFEIIHEKINHRELLEEPRLRRGQRQTNPLREWSDILRCLAVLRERAAIEMNALFQYLRNQSRIVESHVSPVSMIVSIASALRDQEMTHTIIALLSARDSITTRNASDELKNAVQLLAQVGVLTFDREARTYKVGSLYRDALSVLRVQATHLLTTARQRRRENTPARS